MSNQIHINHSNAVLKIAKTTPHTNMILNALQNEIVRLLNPSTGGGSLYSVRDYALELSQLAKDIVQIVDEYHDSTGI